MTLLCSLTLGSTLLCPGFFLKRSLWASPEHFLSPSHWWLQSFWPGMCSSSLFLPQGPEEGNSMLLWLRAFNMMTNGNPSLYFIIQASSPRHCFHQRGSLSTKAGYPSPLPRSGTGHVGGWLVLCVPSALPRSNWPKQRTNASTGSCCSSPVR